MIIFKMKCKDSKYYYSINIQNKIQISQNKINLKENLKKIKENNQIL